MLISEGLRMPKAKPKQSQGTSCKEKERQPPITTVNVCSPTSDMSDNPVRPSEGKPLTEVSLRVRTKEEYRVVRQKMQEQEG